MKKSVVALSLGLLTLTAGTSAFANTGTLDFEGRITAGGCPIEIVNPGDGSVGSTIRLGDLPASQFKSVGEEYVGKRFELVIRDGAACGLADNTATVKFAGTADPTGDYFAVTPTSDGAKGVAISLRDQNNKGVKPNSVTDAFDLNNTGETRLPFDAYYRSTAATVTAGAASATVSFVLDII
ncbi:fimbrial protein [Pseudomonas sp. NPDC089422]|uniref:fimbrial protein n=1 Tax=Pseudomonas sp. NPDC089422 TaxID=3364466 RepID=UPI00380BEBF8